MANPVRRKSDIYYCSSCGLRFKNGPLGIDVYGAIGNALCKKCFDAGHIAPGKNSRVMNADRRLLIKLMIGGEPGGY